MFIKLLFGSFCLGWGVFCLVVWRFLVLLVFCFGGRFDLGFLLEFWCFGGRCCFYCLICVVSLF